MAKTLIIVPYELAAGLITALHLRLGHPKKSQIKKVWDRYFYALDIEKWIDQCMDSCSSCRSLKTIPKELIEQSTISIPDTVGIAFSADIIRRNKQKIILLIDVFSSFKLGQSI